MAFARRQREARRVLDVLLLYLLRSIQRQLHRVTNVAHHDPLSILHLPQDVDVGLVLVTAEAHLGEFSAAAQTRLDRGDADLFPDQKEIRERLAAIARFYGNLIGVEYGEPFVIKETMRVDDITALGVRSL